MTDDHQPGRVPPRIRSAPRIRQIYWCDFPQDVQLPEFSKRRPVVIISKKVKLHGCVIVLPLTIKSQPNNLMACPIINPVNKQLSWVICDHPTTVAVSRLHLPGRTVLRMETDDFKKIVKLMGEVLPRP